MHDFWETIIDTRKCRLTGKEFVITDKDAEFYEKVSPVFPLWKRGTEGDSILSAGVEEGKSPLSLFGKEEEGTGLSKLIAEWKVKIEGDKIRYLIPFPTLCPEARQQRRLTWRNDRRLYNRKCDFTGKDIVSNCRPDFWPPVYSPEVYMSDRWSPMDYGQEYRTDTTFFSQFHELLRRIPMISRFSDPANENCDYSNSIGKSKDCYLTFDSDFCEGCLYGTVLKESQNAVDCLFCVQCSNCYECINCVLSQDLFYCRESVSCMRSSHLLDCVGCSDSFACYGLRSVQWGFFNEICSSREEFLMKRSTFLQDSFAREKIDAFLAMHIPGSRVIRSEKVALSQHISDSFDILGSSQINTSRSIRYSQQIFASQDCMDVSSFGDQLSRSYECLSVGHNCQDMLFYALGGFETARLMYCYSCWFWVEDCFGCVWLHNHERYCILNRQYTRDEYEILVPKIIDKMIVDGEWWEFFPSSMSPFGYNESVAMEYFPLTREEALGYPLPLGEGGGWGSSTAPRFREDRPPAPSPEGEGRDIFPNWPLFNWSDYEPPFPSVEKVIPGEKLPDTIQDVPDDVLNWAIKCETSWKLFKIVQPELEFYRKHSLPLPRKHPDVRHSERVGRR